MKKLYITDLDGTLLNQNASISPYSEQVIKKIIKQGIHFTIATGRSPIRIFSILQNIPLKLPVILMNGAAIYDIENQKCLSTVPICKTSFHRILDTEQKANIRGGYILTQNNQLNGIITVSPTLLLQTYLKTSDLTLIHSNLELKDEETLLYALYMDSSNQKLQFMYDTLNMIQISSVIFIKMFIGKTVGAWKSQVHRLPNILQSNSYVIMDLMNILQVLVIVGMTFHSFRLVMNHTLLQMPALN